MSYVILNGKCIYVDLETGGQETRLGDKRRPVCGPDEPDLSLPGITPCLPERFFFFSLH